MFKIEKLYAKILSFLFSAFIFALAGCVNPVDATYYDADAVADDGNHLKVYATTTDNSIDFSGGGVTGGKSIIPDSVIAGDMYFYLWGKNRITHQTLNVQQVNFVQSDSPNTGFVDYIFREASSYEMTLVCTQSPVTLVSDNVINENNVKAAACFAGFATVDLRYIDHVLFFLSPYNAKSYGSVELKLYMPWTIPGGYNLLIGLYDLTTDRVIYRNDQNHTSTESVFMYSDFQMLNPPDNPNYSQYYLSPGIYNLKVRFVGASQEYVYSEDIYVLPNQCTLATKAIPMVIEMPPTNAPSDFIAGYKGYDSDNNGCYSVEFAWKDNSNNETYFELELLDVTNALDETFNNYVINILDNSVSVTQKDSYWSIVKTSTGVTQTVYTPENYGDSSQKGFELLCTDGALLANNTFVDFNIPLGRRYIARLRGMNGAGGSAYSYVNISPSDTSSLKAEYSTWQSGASSINCYVVKYVLNGGNFLDNGTNVTSKVNLKALASQINGVPLQLLDPTGGDGNGYVYETSKTAKLKIGLTGVEWTKWKLNSAGGNDVSSLSYSGFENVTYYAYYDGSTAAETDQLTALSNAEDESGSSSIMAFRGDNANVFVSSGTDPRRINIVNGHSFTVRRSDYTGADKYIWFIVNNASTAVADRYKYTVSMTASKNYGQISTLTATSSTISYDDEEKKIISAYKNNFGFVNYDCFVINISDLENFENGTYYVNFKFVPTGNEANPIHYFLVYTITD